jgi:hypothetical protein
MLSPRQLKRIMKYQYGIENKYYSCIDYFYTELEPYIYIVGSLTYIQFKEQIINKIHLSQTINNDIYMNFEKPNRHPYNNSKIYITINLKIQKMLLRQLFKENTIIFKK